MATLGNIQDNILGMLARSDTATKTEVARAINRACEHYAGEQFWFNEARISFTCSTGATEYTLSASVVAVLAVTVTRNGSTYAINPVSEQERLALDTQNLSGGPAWYSLYGNKFIPYPSPSDTYTTEISCARKAPTISATSSSNVWTLHAEDLIEARAAYYVAAHWLRDMEAAQAFALAERNALDALRARESGRQSNNLMATKF